MKLLKKRVSVSASASKVKMGYPLRNRANGTCIPKPKVSMKNQKKRKAVSKKKARSVSKQKRTYKAIARSVEITPPHSVTASPQKGTQKKAVPISYTVAELRTMKSSLISNFGIAHRTHKVRACAWKSWIQYWELDNTQRK